MPNPLQKHRRYAAKAQEGRCIYCKALVWDDNPIQFMTKHRLSYEQAKRFRSTAEHLHARCDGGGDNRSNIAAACLVCNQRRHQFTPAPVPERYRQIVRTAVRRRQWHRRWAYESGVVETPGGK